MTIGGISTNISTSQVNDDVQVLMLKKNLDTLEQSGDSLTKMMEKSVNPNLGGNFDVSV